MELKAQFDPQDWQRIVALPMLAGMAVTAADPGGLWGAVRESTAMTSSLLRGGEGGNALVEAVIKGFSESETRGAVTGILRDEVKGKPPAEIVEAILAEVERLSLLIGSKAPDVAPGFRAWLMDLATKVAEAGTEGGFLGFGGVKVSEKEAATLERLRGALGLSATQA